MNNPEVKHTPEPWVVKGKFLTASCPVPRAGSSRNGGPSAMENIGVFPSDADGDYRNFPVAVRYRNLKRAAACVNACAGIPDPETTIPAVIQSLRDLERGVRLWISEGVTERNLKTAQLLLAHLDHLEKLPTEEIT
jgi:hypothetical protein